MSYRKTKRVFDLGLACVASLVLLVPFIGVAIAVKMTSRGPIIYWSDRIGIDNKVFKMPKFRSMKVDTPSVATHLLSNPHQYLSPIGRFIRKTSLDELPQLWCIFKGDMSFVGPRPALFNQEDLVGMRTRNNVHKLLPGLTGLAQISGRDEIDIPLKVQYDIEYSKRISLFFDIKIILRTIEKVVLKRGVSH